jgi:biotin carboxyl carrier protein
MKLRAVAGETDVQVEFKRIGDRIVAKVENREYDLEASQPEPNVYLLKHDGRVFEFYAGGTVVPGQPQIISSGIRDYEVSLIDPKRLRGSAGASGNTDGLVDIKTMMPGKVVRIVAGVGAEVEKGDPILVVEAMKMQNDLKAPKAGTVKEIRAVEGSTVSAGDVLAVVE